MILTYLLRSPGTGHSLETLFGGLRQAGEDQPNLARTVTMPGVSKGIRSVWKNWRFVARLESDVFHVTGDIHYAVLALPPARTLLTIHDCITLRSNRSRPFRYAIFWLFWYYLPIRRAAVVTVVSEKTRMELIQYVGAIARKATVIPNAWHPAFVPQPVQTLNKPPILLQVGTALHKNLGTLLVAIDGLDVILVLVGPLTDATLADLHRRQIHYRNYVDLSQEAIRQLYVACDLVVFISTYEGFGMPILEAQAIGRPVITSDLSPMREVAGGAAHLIDPTDAGAVRQGIWRLLHDTAYRQQLIDAGLTNAQQYSAGTIARQYMALYQRLAQPLSEPLP
ncbi:glycosyltransferase family 4 protein [Spirosoma koreense]